MAVTALERTCYRSPVSIARLFLGSKSLVYRGWLGATAIHSHHAHQVVVAIDGPVALEDVNGEVATGHAAFIPAGVPHAVAASSADVLVALLDPDDITGRRLKTLGPEASARGWFALGAPLAGMPLPLSAAHIADDAAARLVGPTSRPTPVHPAVLRVLRTLPDEVSTGSPTLSNLAAAAGISASRLSHLFRAEVGVALRPYVLWLRIHRAGAALARGASLTEAAHHAGFADGAHLSRVFRRMFGLKPSDIAGHVEWVTPTSS